MPVSPVPILLTSLFLFTMNANVAAGQHFQSGTHATLEVGTIMYNTQITFDGVDDPAGRSGFGYGLSVGHLFDYNSMLLGADLVVTAASVPDPYTFDRQVTGFSEIDLRRGTSVGLDVRAGYAILGHVLAFGSLGYSVNRQAVRIDGTRLEDFAGGSSPKTFGRFQVGAGLEIPVARKLNVRTGFRVLNGFDLDKTDLGAALNTDINRFDIEPRQWYLIAGLVFRPSVILS